MREILFRGKSAEDGKWFTGQLLHFKSPVSEKELNIVVEGCEWDDSNEWFNIGRRAKVVPETVGQYTGLTDKNGKKIFEGDIINSGSYEFLVSHGKCGGCNNTDNYGYIGFYLKPVNEETKLHMRYGLRDDICYYTEAEVIGNIHDNPELLKGGD